MSTEERKQLLNRNNKDKPKVVAPKPEKTTGRNYLDSPSANNKQDNKRVRVRRKIYEDETTTVRIGMSLKYKTDTLIAMGKFEIVHDILDYLLDKYITSELSSDEQRVFKTLLSMKSKQK